jgi:branched-chain amino acid transport system ATP-binding protein
MIEFFRLGHLADNKASGLSYGQQKLLDAAMAFMAGPRLVPARRAAGGVNLTLLRTARAARSDQSAKRRDFVVIEHNMEFVRRCARASRAGGRTYHRTGRSGAGCGATLR